MTSVEKRRSSRKSGGHRKHSDGGYSDTSSGGSFLDETDREVSNLTDRAFRSLCIGDEAVYNDSDLGSSSPCSQRDRQLAFSQSGQDRDREDREREELKRAAHESFSLRVQQYGQDWIHGGVYGAEIHRDPQWGVYGERTQGRVSATFQHAFMEMQKEKSLNDEQLSFFSNGATELSSQQRRSRSRVSSLIKAFNSEGHRDGAGTDGKLREWNDETSWDKSALMSIRRELSEFSTSYQQNFDSGHFPPAGPFSSQDTNFYSSEVAAVAHMNSASSFMRSSHSKHSMLTQVNCNSNFFIHSEFSPFRVWRDHNRFPFQQGEVSGFMHCSEFPKWCETPMYKELSLEAQQQGASMFEERGIRHQRNTLAPTPSRSTSTSTMLQKASAVEKRCESELAGHYPHRKRTQSLGTNRLPSQRPSTASPTIEMSRRVRDTISSVKALQHKIKIMTEQNIATEMTANKSGVFYNNENLIPIGNNAVTAAPNVVSNNTSTAPFNISQLLTPQVHAHQETTEVQQYAVSPQPVEHAPVRAESRGATPDVRMSSYKSRASSLLFNLKDNRKRVKSTYSPTKFKGLETLEKNKQPSSQEPRDIVIDIPEFPDSDIKISQVQDRQVVEVKAAQDTAEQIQVQHAQTELAKAQHWAQAEQPKAEQAMVILVGQTDSEKVKAEPTEQDSIKQTKVEFNMADKAQAEHHKAEQQREEPRKEKQIEQARGKKPEQARQELIRAEQTRAQNVTEILRGITEEVGVEHTREQQSEQVKAEQADAGRLKEEHIKTELVKTEHAGQARTEQAKTQPGGKERLKAEQVEAQLVRAEQAEREETEGEQIRAAKVKAELADAERRKAKQSKLQQIQVQQAKAEQEKTKVVGVENVKAEHNVEDVREKKPEEDSIRTDQDIIAREKKDHTDNTPKESSAKIIKKDQGGIITEEKNPQTTQAEDVNEKFKVKINHKDDFNRADVETLIKHDVQPSVKEDMTTIINPSKSRNIDDKSAPLLEEKRHDSNQSKPFIKTNPSSHLTENDNQVDNNIHIDSIAIRVVPAVTEKDNQKMMGKHTTAVPNSDEKASTLSKADQQKDLTSVSNPVNLEGKVGVHQHSSKNETKEEDRRAKQREDERRMKEIEEERRAKLRAEEERMKAIEERKRVKQREEEIAAQEEQQRRAALIKEQRQKAKQVEEEKRLASIEEERKRKQREEERAAQEEQQRRAALIEEQRQKAKQVEEEKRLAFIEEERKRKQREEERAAQEEQRRRDTLIEEQRQKATQIEEERRRKQIEEERAAQEEQRQKAKQIEEERRRKQREEERAAREEQQRIAAQIEEQRRKTKQIEDDKKRLTYIEEERKRKQSEEERAAQIAEEKMIKQIQEQEKHKEQVEGKRRERQNKEEWIRTQNEEEERRAADKEKAILKQREEQQANEERARELEEASQAAQREEKRVARERLQAQREEEARAKKREEEKLAAQREKERVSQVESKKAAQRMDALQYYAITSTESEKKLRERQLRSPAPSQHRNNELESAEDSGSYNRLRRSHNAASPAPSLPRSNTSSPAHGAKPSMFRVKDNTIRGSYFTKSVKPRFHKNFGEDFRVGSPWSDRGDEEPEIMRRNAGTPIHPDTATRLAAIKESSTLQLSSSQDYSAPLSHHRPYNRRSFAMDEDDSRSVISNMSEDVESFVTSVGDVADIRGLYDYERPESACSFSSDVSRLGKPPVVPPKSEKALLRAKRLAKRRIKKELSKATGDSPAEKSLQEVSSTPSTSSSEVCSSNRHAVASPHFSPPVSLARAPALESSLPSSHSEPQPSRHSFHASPHATAPVSLPVASPHATTPVSLPVASPLATVPVSFPVASPNATTSVSLPVASPHATTSDSLPFASPHVTGPISHHAALKTVAHVPSSPTLHHTNHPAPVTQYHVESSYPHSYPLTQRKVLQDLDSGQYFVVDVPVQVKTKTFFDPETGKYVQLNVRQSGQSTSRPQSQQAHPQPQLQPQVPAKQQQQRLSQASPAGKPYVVYQGYQGYPQGYQPAGTSSVHPQRSSSVRSTPVTVSQDQQPARENHTYRHQAPENEQNSEGHRYSPEKTPYMDTVNDKDKTHNTVYNTHGSYECDTNSQLAESLVRETDNSAHSRYESRDIITMGELEDFMEVSDW
ncbi:titin homolog [Scomber japonicus]|uniref:titin homolog n=1 Tax=Scomber japonicus TaxID=13676 RepID=UPI00230687DA|nr:titin homolog [Scomber japonicus]